MISKQIFIVFTIFVLGTCNTNTPFHLLMDVISTQSPKNQFKLWHYAMQKSYDLNSEIALQKYKSFKANLKLINDHNSRQSDYKLGLGPFTDMSWEEFKESNLNDLSFLEKIEIDKSWMKAKEINFDSVADEDDDLTVPQTDYTQGPLVSKDWSNLHFQPKNQAPCGSCWAFGTIATFEAQFLIKGQNVLLSEQELIDCSKNQYNSGCRGGVIQIAFDYIYHNGIAQGRNYNYTGVDTGACKAKSTQRAVRSFENLNNCSDFQGLAQEKCTPQRIIQFLNDGPVATNIEVTDGLQHYRHGKWYPINCVKINHTVEIVSVVYDPRTGSGSVVIRNSWGNWGMNGKAEIAVTPNQGMPGCGALLHAVGPVELR